MGWSFTISGDMEIVSDAEFENLRSYARSATQGATAYGLAPTESTVEPAQGTSDVGVTDAEQVANAQKQEDAKADKKAKEAEAEAKAQQKAQAKAEADAK